MTIHTFAKYLSTFLILLTTSLLSAGTVSGFKVYSPSMGMDIDNIAILPKGYQSSGVKYNYVVMLHGHGGSCRDWISAVPALRDYVDKAELILICPDGHVNSWYIDSPVDPTSRFATYISHELIAHIENRFPVLKGEGHRAITGFSMGGHGALYAAFRYPRTWDYAGSISGAADIRMFPDNWELAELLGPFRANADVWDRYSVNNILHNPKDDPYELHVSCGRQDFFFGVNKQLVNLLEQKDISHVVRFYNGRHSWSYVSLVIFEQLDFFTECFN